MDRNLHARIKASVHRKDGYQDAKNQNEQKREQKIRQGHDD